MPNYKFWIPGHFPGLIWPEKGLRSPRSVGDGRRGCVRETLAAHTKVRPAAAGRDLQNKPTV